MKILCINELCLTNGLQTFDFKRMKVYSLPKIYALELIEQGYAVRFGFMDELSLKEELKQ